MRDAALGVVDAFWLMDHKRLPKRLGSRIVFLGATSCFVQGFHCGFWIFRLTVCPAGHVNGGAD